MLILVPIAIFLCLLSAPMPPLAAQASSPKLTTDQPFYPIWKLGGTITLTASQLIINQTYNVWLQRPTEPLSHNLGIQFKGTNGTITNQVTVTVSDPPGTYTLSLSTSSSSDTRDAVAHFGVFGTNAKSYARTQQIQISGGGYFPNSTVTVTMLTAGGAVPGSPFNVKSGPKGDLSYSYKLPPNLRTGALIISTTGRPFDQNRSAVVSSQVSVGPTSVNIKPLTQGPSEVERTAQTAASYQMTYPDGSPVTTATTNSTRVIIVNDQNGKTAGEARLTLSDTANGIWKVIWASSPSANLSAYHFEFSPANFDDSYGNLGKGQIITSNDFQLVRADLPLIFQANSTLQRTQETDIVITATYHDNTNFANIIQTTGTLTRADGTSSPLSLTYNSTLKEFIAHMKVPIGAPVGKWRFVANARDAYGNTASGVFTFQVVNASLRFSVDSSGSLERTTILNVTATITYPDGSIMTPDQIPSSFNVTISQGNFTWTHIMSFDVTTSSWYAGYDIPQNATLGQYSVAMLIEDSYGNGGQFETSSRIIPARFRFAVPQPTSKVNPLQFVDVPVHVTYPNGSALTPRVGGVVTASMTNSTGAFTFPMVYNSTDQSWHLYFNAPNLGFSFGATVTFSFDAADQFGNSGSTLKAYELDVGAGTQTLILATILGGIVPIALLAWAIATITTRRRKHKP